ncbi:MAG: choice-of-anchor I family protein [Cyanobacteria bacterium P01_A01_bin.123]
MTFTKILSLTAPVIVLSGAIATPAAAFSLTPIGVFGDPIFDEGAAEISAYDAESQQLFITNANANTVDIVSISDPTNPFLVNTIELDPFGGGVNSVAFSNGTLAVAVEADVAQDPGQVVLFESTGDKLKQFTVGALPDMVTFTPDGTKILVANEGEPSDDYTVDPEGSVSIINLLDDSVTTAGFTQFNNANLDDSIRIFGPNASVAQDLEPEYITVSADGTTAYVALQENNALGILDIENGVFTDLVGLDFKDHGEDGNGLDASDDDDAINITTYDNLFGMPQPDAIASFEVDGETYLITANEGDAREYAFEDANGDDVTAFAEEERVEDLDLDPDAFPNADELQTDENLGRFIVTTTEGDIDGDGDYDELYAFGTRSISIWDAQGNLVWDSGDALEKITAELLPEAFNSTNDENGSFDSRSDAKGPEPEGVTVGVVDGEIYAFVGLERIGGVVTYRITDPENPVFVDYINPRNFDVEFDEDNLEDFPLAGDLGPEGLLFIDGIGSPNGSPLLVVTNEVSGTTRIYQVEGDSASVPEPGMAAGLVAIAALGVRQLKLRQVGQ